ncbi:deaminase [Pseudonocardia sp. CNS-004]|nr:deaminase [Pseudonocardia sp. CNS-004]
MGRVVYDMSTSLDGFVSAAGATAEEPLGIGGERLHAWAFAGDEVDRKVLGDGVGSLGAVVTGRRTYDQSLPFWGPNGPTGEARLPLFVVTHSAPASSPEDGVYRFVTDGPERALAEAVTAAGDKGVGVMGTDVARQLVRAGLVDEIVVHVVPVLFGSGDRFFDDDGQHVELEVLEVVPTAAATHIRHRVIGPAHGSR